MTIAVSCTALVQFFKVKRIVSLLICGNISSSTALSARSLTVQCENPSGGAPHANAIKRASFSPVTIGGFVGFSRFLNLRVSSILFVQKSFIVL
jgi:hypothetical protein